MKSKSNLTLLAMASAMMSAPLSNDRFIEITEQPEVPYSSYPVRQQRPSGANSQKKRRKRARNNPHSKYAK